MVRKGQKKLQREINKVVKEQNQALKKDEIFRGRYVIKQNRVLSFENSEFRGLCYITVEDQIIDTRTNKVIGTFTLSHSSGSMMLIAYNLFKAINPFFCSVYDENRAEVFGE